MIKWEDDREMVLKKLEAIEEHVTNLRIRIYGISLFVSCVVVAIGFLLRAFFLTGL